MYSDDKSPRSGDHYCCSPSASHSVSLQPAYLFQLTVDGRSPEAVICHWPCLLVTINASARRLHACIVGSTTRPSVEQTSSCLQMDKLQSHHHSEHEPMARRPARLCISDYACERRTGTVLTAVDLVSCDGASVVCREDSGVDEVWSASEALFNNQGCRGRRATSAPRHSGSA